MPLLAAPADLSTEAVAAAWRSLWPAEIQPELEAREGSVAFTLDGVVGGATIIPGPIPGEGWDEIAQGAWLWPDAATAVPTHQAHALVFASASDALAAFSGMTRMASSVIQATDALGVYMGEELIVRADIFTAMAREVEIPTALWVDFRCMRSPSGEQGLYTTGLAQFGLMELEIPGSTSDCGALRLWAMDIAAWILEQRPEIRDGDTIGRSAEERVTVTHAPSMIDREGTVWRLTGV